MALSNIVSILFAESVVSDTIVPEFSFEEFTSLITLVVSSVTFVNPSPFPIGIPSPISSFTFFNIVVSTSSPFIFIPPIDVTFLFSIILSLTVKFFFVELTSSTFVISLSSPAVLFHPSSCNSPSTHTSLLISSLSISCSSCTTPSTTSFSLISSSIFISIFTSLPCVFNVLFSSKSNFSASSSGTSSSHSSVTSSSFTSSHSSYHISSHSSVHVFVCVFPSSSVYVSVCVSE